MNKAINFEILANKYFGEAGLKKGKNCTGENWSSIFHNDIITTRAMLITMLKIEELINCRNKLDLNTIDTLNSFLIKNIKNNTNKHGIKDIYDSIEFLEKINKKRIK